MVKKSLSLLENTDDHKMASDIYRKLAILSKVTSDFDAYEKYSEFALKKAIESGDWELVSSSLIVWGNVHFQKNDYSKALKYYLKVDSIGGEISDTNDFSIPTSRIWSIH